MNHEDADPQLPPLAGLRVADFSRVLAGPYATMMLADLGADVIKIESPEGDGTRQWLPPVNAAGQSTYYAGVNRGKRSVVLDLRSDDGRARARELASTADVVIENFKPGTMARFGLGYDELAEANPALVYCSISGFGDGAGADLPGYDLLVQAVGGLMSITGKSDADGGEPTKAGVALVDVLTGLNAVVGIQAALRARDTTGRGQHVKLTLLGSLLSALANQSAGAVETGVSPGRMGNGHPSITPYDTYAAADQQLALAVGTDAQFARLCEVLGVPELSADPRFIDNPTRVAHRDELRVLIEQCLAAKPAAEWAELLTAANVPAGRVNTVGQALELAEVLGLAPVVSTPALSPAGEAVTLHSIATPISFSATAPRYGAPPPQLGEHDGASWLDTEPGATPKGTS